MAAKTTRDWADLDDDVQETAPTATGITSTTLTSTLPPPQTITNKDGTKLEITYSLNDANQKVKTTRRIRLVAHREIVNPRVADRKTWGKFGRAEKDAQGPNTDTTTVGENIIFKPSANWRLDAKNDEKDPNAVSLKDQLRDKKVKCRICGAEHFTAKCPYKDTMAPVGEDAAAGEVLDGPTGATQAALQGRDGPGAKGGAAGGKTGSYVPPAMRAGASGRQGESMGGKFGERDDLATLRVTNVSEMAEEGELRDMFERFGRVTRVFLAKDRDTGRAKGFAFISFADRLDAARACEKMDGWGFKHLILKVEFSAKKA